MIQRIRNDAAGEAFCVFVVAFAAFAVMLPVMIKGLPNGWDLPHHYQCAMTFVDSIRAGELYPSWSLNRNFGYGGMETRLYPPISHYTLALAYLLTADWFAASWITLFLFTFAGGIGVYLLAREYSSPWQAAFAGCVFTVLPYHLVQIYSTFFFAEYAGTCVLPFPFLFIARVCRRGKLSDVIGLAVSFAVLVLTHLPLTVIGSICFVIYGAAMLRRERILSQIAKLSAGSLLGLIGSSFFWVKVLQERSLLAKTLIYPDPWLDYNLHFLLTPLQNFVSGLHQTIYENSTLYYDLTFLCLAVLVGFFSVPLFAGGRKFPRPLVGAIAVFAAAAFMATPFSRPLWDRIALLQEVQFPWRWLAIASVMTPVIAAGGLDHLATWFKTARRPFALVICGALLAVVAFSVFQIIRPAAFTPIWKVESQMQKIEASEGFTFWWTIWTRKEALEVREKVKASDRSVDVSVWEPTERTFEIAAGTEPIEARVAVFYLPNWKATVNEKAVEPRLDPNGACLVDIPAEGGTVSLRFVESRQVQVASAVSLFTWSLLLLVIVVGLIRRFTAGHSLR